MPVASWLSTDRNGSSGTPHSSGLRDKWLPCGARAGPGGASGARRTPALSARVFQKSGAEVPRTPW